MTATATVPNLPSDGPPSPAKATAATTKTATTAAHPPQLGQRTDTNLKNARGKLPPTRRQTYERILRSAPSEDTRFLQNTSKPIATAGSRLNTPQLCDTLALRRRSTDKRGTHSATQGMLQELTGKLAQRIDTRRKRTPYSPCFRTAGTVQRSLYILLPLT
ncbi:hypothetical protein BDW68DRAFT_165697 [Aspergillus falconensis]